MGEIILCRHGYTPANADSCNGDVKIRDVIYYDELCPLEKRYGRKQVDELGQFLAENYSGKKILLCYSPHYRTRETMNHVKEFLAQHNEVSTCCVPAIREINQGLNYAKFRKSFDSDDFEAQFFYDHIKGTHRVGMSYMQGESEREVRQRVRRFSQALKEYEKTSQFNGAEYDLLVAISHSTTIKAIYYDMYRKSSGVKMTTASAMKVSDNPELVFKPKTQVPEDYVVDFDEYKDYFKLREFYEHLDSLRSDIKFHAFFGGHIRMPLVEETSVINGCGENGIVLPGNTERRGMYLIDSCIGRDYFAYDKKSTSTYWVLEGEGEFDIAGKKLSVKKGDLIFIPPFTTFYYKGKMKLVAKAEPNLQKDNIIEVARVNYDNNLASQQILESKNNDEMNL